jgi:AcrR family transcriptional regulator
MVPARMVTTPWGDASTLRERRLPPGPGTPREEVERNQRERLYAAMVAVAREKGYAGASVADLVELSGVSSRSFYDLFADKEACFLATMEEILAPARAITASRMWKEGSWEERARDAFATFVRLLAAQPAAAWLCLVESYAAGPAAVARMDEGLAGFEELLARALAERPGRGEMPPQMVRAMVGGMRKIVHTRLQRGSEAELLESVPALLDLGLSYEPPPRPLRARRRRGGPGSGGPDGPGDVGGGGAAGRDKDEDPGERIVRAAMKVIAAKGYPGARVADIVEAAGASLNTFYARFDGKQAAFDAALYSGRARMLGMALPAYKRARSWPEAIRAVTEATLAYLEGEPDFAKLIAVDVYAAGAEALERRDLAIEAAQRFIDDGAAEHAPQMPPIAREGIISDLYAMLCDRVRSEGVVGLREMAPLATYMALSPFIGAEAACAVANGGAWEGDS